MAAPSLTFVCLSRESCPHSSIVAYAWSLGTTPGGDDIYGPEAVGLETEAAAHGLELTPGVTYYSTVYATNAAGLTSSGSSSGAYFMRILFHNNPLPSSLPAAWMSSHYGAYKLGCVQV